MQEATSGSCSPCIEWTGARIPEGYGQKWNPRTKKAELAHRLAWEKANGPIPAGMFVCHKCDNPPCVNPEHLFLGTPKDNMADKCRKGRQPRGETHPRAKLTERDVREIRRADGHGSSQRELARLYGVSPRSIQFIIQRRTWTHV